MGSVEDVSSPGRSSRGGLGVGFTGRGVDESGVGVCGITGEGPRAVLQIDLTFSLGNCC